MQPLAIQILPDKSWSAIAKNLALPPCWIFVTNLPSGVISENLLSRFSRGTRTWSKESLALSTPFMPICKKQSKLKRIFLIMNNLLICICIKLKNHLVTHIFNGDPWNRVEFVVAASNDDAMNSLVLSVDVELSKNDNVLGVASTVCDLSRVWKTS